jgi:SAM-dependent methyltransferase
VKSILDFGCGYGADVRYYQSLAIKADGYDVEAKFGWPRPARTNYDLVTVVFVVNVLPTRDERLAAVRAAAGFARPGGYVLVAARSPAAVAAAAQKGGWVPFHDGWISSASKGTFQRGIPREELKSLLGEAGLEVADVSLRLTSDVSWLVGRKRDDQ